MRRFLPVLFLLISSSFLFGQNATANLGKFGLGINMGGAYQQGDMRPVKYGDSTDLKTGFGYGFTADYWFIKNQTSLIGLGLRGRYLHTKSRGLQVEPFHDMQSYNALNGNNLLSTDYTNQSVMFNNYEMTYDEGSLELLLSANRLRANTGILLYGWGGIGIYGGQTMTNLTNDFGLEYDYSLIDSTGSKSQIANQLADILDDTYESNAEGNDERIVDWDPTAGLGIGYDFGPVSIALEHKVSFLRHDYADGILGENNFLFAKNNDVHHYTNFGLIFHIGANSDTEFSYDDPIGDPLQNNLEQDNSIKNPPIVNIINPSANPYSTNNSNLSVTGKVINVAGKSDITVTVNGVNSPFNYNGSTHLVVIPTQLNIGNNEVIITGTNSLGSDNDKLIIVYTKPQNSINPPTVDITTPSANPHTQLEDEAMVAAKVKNVTSKDEIFVKVNGQFYSQFEYNSQTQMIFMNIDLNAGPNKVEVAAMNAAGSDEDETIIILDGPKPIVNITVPTTDPYSIEAAATNVTATIKNVDSKNDVTVTINGNQTQNFMYSVSAEKLAVSVPLVLGNNIVEITGSNLYGADSDVQTIIRTRTETEVIEQECDEPEVRYLSPAVSPFQSQTKVISIRAKVTNVSGKSNISVKLNGSNINNFNYSTTTKFLMFDAVLNEGMNTVVVTAQNDCGQDVEISKINYEIPQVETETGNNNSIINNNGNQTINANNKPNGNNNVTTVNNGNNQNNTGSNKPNGNNNNNVSLNNNTNTNNNVSNKPNGNNNVTTANTNNNQSNSGTNKPNGGTTNNSVSLNNNNTSNNGSNKPNGNNSLNTGNNGSVSSTKPCADPEVVLITPATDNSTYNGGNPYQFKCKVLNVKSKNDIKLIFNGDEYIHFNFNVSTGVLTSNLPLKHLLNNIQIKASNKCGSVDPLIKIIYRPLNQNGNGENPTILVETPAGSNPYTVSTANISFNAEIKHVQSKTYIEVWVNGKKKTNHSYNPTTEDFKIQLNGLKVGNNTVRIKAVNGYGILDETYTIKRSSGSSNSGSGGKG